MTVKRSVPSGRIPNLTAPEWVVINEDGRLAMVQTRRRRGVEVILPLGGRPLKLPADAVRKFNPDDYPVQISASKRRQIKANGQKPMDEIEKVCNQCFTIKPVSAFDANQTRSDGSTIYRPTCSQCRTGVDGVRNHANRKDGSVPIRPPTGLFWRCPICEKDGIVGVTVKLALDHDHLTGDARDYICDSCNTGLGRFRNGRDFLENAINFLDQWNSDY